MRVRDGEMAVATARRERCSWSDSYRCDGCNDPIMTRPDGVRQCAVLYLRVSCLCHASVYCGRVLTTNASPS